MKQSESISPSAQVKPGAATITRSEMVDIAKGIAIILVVYGHVMQGMDHRGLVSRSFHLFSNTLVYSFHMPAFFFIAGLFSRLDSKTSSVDLLKRRSAQLLWPYVLWICIYQALHPIVGRWTSGGEKPFHLAAFLSDVVSGQGMWFLYALFLVHAIGILTRRVNRVLIFTLSAIAYCAIGSLFSLNPDFLFTAIIQRVVSNLPFFVIGSRWSGEILDQFECYLSENAAVRWGRTALVAVILCGLLATLAWIKTSWSLYSWSPLLTFGAAIDGILMLMVVSRLLEEARAGKLLSLAGAASIAVFLLHPFAQGFIRVVWAQLFGTGAVVSSVLAQTLVTVALATLAYFLAKRAKATWLFSYPLRQH